MDATIPRNELSAILLCMELAFLVKSALGDLVDKIIYCTDSTIALSWCRNMKIKLQLFVYNRFMTILRMCKWTTDRTEVPLFYIDGKHNLADLLSKKQELSVESVTLNSVWQTGLPWMRLDTENMPLLAYDHLRVEKPIGDEVRVECYDNAMTGEFSQFEESSVHHSNSISSLAAGSARVQVNMEVDPVLHGWTKTLRLINFKRS